MNIYFLKVWCPVWVKYNSTKETKIQVFRFGKGNENVYSIDSL